ncbi:MarR family winged helix-turn-helix transcriptional regulator [Phreatobacter sp. AB_2022a]|uniref:MarR family winged helix-turn-helix transcriptional regulator n=1 Tax=Phreatobacter sp. AB_2022a TaxID=3003134 RepID=UPI0022876B4B|nr:MarR family winged helix-turn-helix transcriptional regulator [Phreatobacter sp. AB_2022a]MCZ0733265.1 MarR family winged helix-turn-helix transcriptional regulator [Phreatobacter sp. AB_2022a]
MTLDRSRSAGYLTNWAARLFARAIDRRLKPMGISSGQLPVFFALGDNRALSQKALTEAAAIEQPTMAATLSRMERDGLVDRRPDPKDGRSTLVSLTPAGLAKMGEVRAAVEAVNAGALASLDPTEREAYLKALATIIGALGAMVDGDER